MDRRNFLAGLAIAPIVGLATLKFPESAKTNYFDVSKYDISELSATPTLWRFDPNTGQHYHYDIVEIDNDNRFVRIKVTDHVTRKSKCQYMTLAEYEKQAKSWGNLRNP